jgi:NADPH:quinone reductase
LHIERRDALEPSANQPFDVMASGKVRIDANQRFALKDAASAHKGVGGARNLGLPILTT